MKNNDPNPISAFQNFSVSAFDKDLPFMRNFEDAAALFEQSKDPFYLAAFLIQCWLGDLVQRSAAQYSENKNPKDRSLQSGEAWRSLREFFTLPLTVQKGRVSSVEYQVGP